MRPDIRDAWCKALRSGEYVQAAGQLHNEDGGYCCLGVLSEIIKDDATIKAAGWEFNGTEWYKGENNGWMGSLPYDIEKLVGFDGRLNQGDLIDLNDDKKAPFAAIADYIEAHTV